MNKQKWEDMLKEIGFDAYRIGLDASTAFIAAKIPVVGKYIAVAIVAVGVVDFLFNVSDVSQQCIGLYALSSAASYLGWDFAVTMNGYPTGSNYRGTFKIVECGYDIISAKYYNLAMMRLVAEKQMQNANEAKAWFIEWLYSRVIYNNADIQANLDKLQDAGFLYRYVGQMPE